MFFISKLERNLDSWVYAARDSFGPNGPQEVQGHMTLDVFHSVARSKMGQVLFQCWIREAAAKLRAEPAAPPAPTEGPK